ncbi:hypothetical protein CRI93_13800 [Longimonas halophila]|uniref:ADP-ribosylglycohydrolase n=1 Tax=Longimonas halophila TaxID=1469170 RepID=A0A2H3NPZ2_9BACT|nr:ADP-ribosylglycohydrolase family protein [Longimonas halophila]PEN05088.1 hypothetical protein CRI93_13800 [Longimonas halophila]
MTTDTCLGTLLGTAVGDALGMPVEGLSHQNIRTYYKGIKEYRDDDGRGDLSAGQWTDDTQFTFAVARVVATAAPDQWPAEVAAEYTALQDEARRWGPTTTAAIERLANGTPPLKAGRAERPTDGAAMRAAPLGLWWAASDLNRDAAFPPIRDILSVTHAHPAALAAGWGQAAATRYCATHPLDTFDRTDFWEHLVDTTTWAEEKLGDDARVSDRLKQLSDQLREFPLDLRDVCNGANVAADEAWPFAVAMVARAPQLLENTPLSGINVGGDADTTGAMMGALLGTLHGWDAFPDEWKTGLEAADHLRQHGESFARRILPAESAA